MRNRWVIIGIGATFFILIWLANVARNNFFQKPIVDGENVLFAPSYQLAKQVDEDLVAVADDIHLEKDAAVNGDVALLGSHVIIDGSIDGDLAVMSESLKLSALASLDGSTMLLVNDVVIDGAIDGDLTIVGDSLTISPAAQIEGNIYACAENITNSLDIEIEPCDVNMSAEDYAFFDALQRGDYSRLFGSDEPITGGSLLFVVLTGLALAGISALAVTLFPLHITNMRRAIDRNPAQLAGAGFVTLLLAGAVVVIFTILVLITPLALILSPFILAGGLLILGMLIAGWVTLALFIGERLIQRSAYTRTPPLVSVAVGGIALFGLWSLIGLLPLGFVVQFIVWVALGTIGLGAALQTRMGTRPVLPVASTRLAQIHS
jgi:cytoskeletal protein CcmA (bactofilin family)